MFAKHLIHFLWIYPLLTVASAWGGTLPLAVTQGTHNPIKQFAYEHVQEQIRQWLKAQKLVINSEQTSYPKIEVQHLSTAAETFAPPCSHFNAIISGNGQAWGRTLVQVRCANPDTPATRSWLSFVPLEVKVIGPVLVAKQAIPAGSELHLDQFNLEEKNWAALSFSSNNLPARDEQILDRQLTSALNPGQILRQEQLRVKPLINTGSPVRIQLLSGSVTISAEGKALGSGMLGQTVRVQTEQGKTLMGVIKNEREVEVNLKNL